MKNYDLYLTGTVGWNFTADYIRYVLDRKQGKQVNVAICSLGGYVSQGLQIYELFKNHGDVHVDFIGMSASAATFMAMSAKTICMAKNALILIHNSMDVVSEWGMRNKEQIDATISRLKLQRDKLDTIDDVLAQIYSERNGKSVDDIKAKMKVAAWIKASDAKDFGIVDEIIEAQAVSKPVNFISNQIINDMGLPPLPKDFSLEESEENPAGIIQRAMEMLKGLVNHFASNQEKMIKIFTSVMALLTIKDGFEPDNEGNIALTQDQMKTIDDQLKLQDKACKEAKGVIDSLKEKIKNLEADVKSKDEVIKNLKEGPGENGSKAEEVVTDSLNGAAELFNSIKDAL